MTRGLAITGLPALLMTLVLVGCSSTRLPPATSGSVPPPPVMGDLSTDGPPSNPPPDLARTPDPEPKVEPIRAGGPNKPYQALGEVYIPIVDDQPVVQKGLASWYGRRFHGKPTASGELYNMYAMTAAHPTLPIPSYARVRNPANGREVIVRVNDRGPFAKNRIVDLSYTAALKLDILRGVTPVELERITHESIRTGGWRRGAAAPAEAAAPGSSSSTSVALASDEPQAEPAAGSPVRTRELWGQELRLDSAGSNANNVAPGVVVASAPTPLPPPQPANGLVEAPGQKAQLTQVAALNTRAPVRAAAPAAPPASPPSAAAAAEVQIDPARTAAGRGWWLQIGAFRDRNGALNYQRDAAQGASWIAPLLALFDEKGLHKLQAGPFPTKGEAQSASHRLRHALSVTPILVERR